MRQSTRTAARAPLARPRARPARCIALALLAALLAGGPGLAAQLSQLPPDVRLPPDATGRIQQRLREAPTPPPEPPPPSLQVEPPPVEEAPASAADIPLTIESVSLVGATVYKREELEQYWKDRLGKPGKLGDLFDIASAITARYRNDGYVLSRAVVPAQEIENGKVELRVIEGYVAHVIFKGSDDRPDILRATGEHITDVRPVRVSDLERYLLLLNDLPGATVTSVLQPATDQTGGADLVITVEKDIYQNFTTVDDRGTRYVGPVQYTLGTRINSVFGWGDQTFIRGITTPLYPNELMAFDFINQQSLDEEGTTLALQLNFAEAHPGYSLSPFKLTSDASTIAFVLAHPFIRSRTENLRFNVQAVANEYHTTSDSPAGDGSGGSGSTTLLRDSIRSLRVGLLYDSIDKYQGANLAGLQFSQGLPILGASHPGATFLSRASGRPDYNKLNFDVSRAQSLAEHWTLINAITAQKAFTSLLSSEQLGLGGSTFLRSYDPSDLVGDTGIAAKFELQYSNQPNEWYLKNYDLYSYFDIGKVQNRVVGPGDKASDSGISIGLGSRFTLTEWSNGYLELSQPIMRGVPTQGIHDHHPRIFFALIAKF